MENVLEAWMPMWARESRRREQHPQDWRRGSKLEAISGAQVRAALDRYQKNTGLGWDRRHPRLLKQMPDSYSDRLVDIFDEL